MSVVDCRLNPFAFPAPGDQVAEHVPAPYGTSNSPVASLGLEVYACGGVVIDNETVVQDVRFAWTIIPVEPPEKWAGPPGTNHVFVTEFFLPEALAGPFSDLGFPVTVDTVSTSEGDGVEVAVEVDGAILYKAVGHGRYGMEQPIPWQTRNHFSTSNGVKWIDDNSTIATASLPDTVHLNAVGGTLYDVSPAVGQLVGQSNPQDAMTPHGYLEDRHDNAGPSTGILRHRRGSREAMPMSNDLGGIGLRAL
jgi:hypothetical protein